MSEQIMRENLLVIAQTYATAKGLSLSTVSKKIHGNQAFLAGFLEGKNSTTLKTYFAMLDVLRGDWPAGVEWPETNDIKRPARFNRRAPTAMPDRAGSGRFLGKKHSKRTRAA